MNQPPGWAHQKIIEVLLDRSIERYLGKRVLMVRIEEGSLFGVDEDSLGGRAACVGETVSAWLYYPTRMWFGQPMKALAIGEVLVFDKRPVWITPQDERCAACDPPPDANREEAQDDDLLRVRRWHA